jgi:DNA polymerase-3 subunit alpha
VRVAGVRIASRRHVTAKGDAMGFVTLEDESGTAEVVLFPEAWKRALPPLFRDGPLEVEGTVEDQHGAVTLTGERVRVWEG